MVMKGEGFLDPKTRKPLTLWEGMVLTKTNKGDKHLLKTGYTNISKGGVAIESDGGFAIEADDAAAAILNFNVKLQRVRIMHCTDAVNDRFITDYALCNNWFREHTCALDTVTVWDLGGSGLLFGRRMHRGLSRCQIMFKIFSMFQHFALLTASRRVICHVDVQLLLTLECSGAIRRDPSHGFW
jgi:hypothetical protein